MSNAPQSITITDDGVTLPTEEVLTGRGFITGKSGSGKSNSANVIAEELLENEIPLLIVDIDGEYWGLKESFEILHFGVGEECDAQIAPGDATKIANLALEDNVPIILDVSGFMEEEDVKELLNGVIKILFQREKKMKKPFLLIVEEIHEFLPESGRHDALAKSLIQVAKRGRKHGLGIIGISQRPAAVQKDFITQCDWIVWHRLTWDNDTKVVGRILGKDYEQTIQDLDDGEAYLMTDWDDSIIRIRFRRKFTFDAGASPGLGDLERRSRSLTDSDILSELGLDADDLAKFDRGRQQSDDTDELPDAPDELKAIIQEQKQTIDGHRHRIEELEERIKEPNGQSSPPQENGQEDGADRRDTSQQEEDTVLMEFGLLVVHVTKWLASLPARLGRLVSDRSTQSSHTTWTGETTRTRPISKEQKRRTAVMTVLVSILILTVLIFAYLHYLS